MPSTLQQAQTNALLTLLNLNNPIDTAHGTPSNATKPGSSTKAPATTGPPVWKVLILDQYTKDVLATVLRVQDLRDVGVTLHVYACILSTGACSKTNLATDSYTLVGRLYLTCQPYTWSRQRRLISNGLHMILRSLFMSLSI